MRGRGWLGALAGALVLIGAGDAHAGLEPRARILEGPGADPAATVASFSFDADGPAPGATFECRVDAAQWAACASPVPLRDLTGGPHRFEVRLTGLLVDGTPDERRWTVQQQTTVVDPCAGGCANPVPAVPETTAPLPPRANRRRDARGCAYGANEPGDVPAVALRRALLCLLNVERRAHGLRPVRRSAGLERAAASQARDMVLRRYFAHVSPGGRTVADRVAATGYLRGVRAWTVGEVLAWLLRPRPTAAATVTAWMHSPPHRAVLLRPNFREAGASFMVGNPRTRGGATWAAVLGRRR